jgi:predicted DNA-binding ribbon-helix-helix protein
MGVVTLMPQLRNSTHSPLVPNVHYVSVAVDCAREDPKFTAAAIRETYERHRNDEEFLSFVRANAMDWYDKNVRFTESIPLTLRLLGLH